MNMKTILIGLALFALSAQGESAVHEAVVYQQDGRFAGWPANNAAWNFAGEELLVGFTEGPYLERKGHNLNEEDPLASWLARSLDGGETWQAFDPAKFVGDYGDEPELRRLDRPMKMTSPDFALRIVGAAYHGAEDGRGHFFFSEDRGHNWQGPFALVDRDDWAEFRRFGFDELTPRTDYVVLGPHRALIMISARLPGKFATDRIAAFLTEDGGQSFSFRGWVEPPEGASGYDPTRRAEIYADSAQNPHPSEVRAVMSQTVILPDGNLVTTIRRRYEDRNWVDCYRSTDEGLSWSFQSTVGDAGTSNGNPPALNLTADGRLCAVYGDRAAGQIVATYSSDQGATWSSPRVLRDDFESADMETNDLGYPRLLRRPDGRMVALYYYSTRDYPHGIFATIFDPAQH
jgi:hypothetical protein